MNITYPVISDVHETTSLIGKLLNTRVSSTSQPHLASISSKELPPTTLVSNHPSFYKLTMDFLAFSMDSMPLQAWNPKTNCYRIQRHSLKLRTRFDKGHKNMCCTTYYLRFLQNFMQFDSIIWHSTSHITHAKDDFSSYGIPHLT